MALLRLVLRVALRNRVRSAATALGVAIALVAFLTLRTLVGNWYSVNAAAAKSDQLEVRHKISIMFNVYKRMAERIRAVPGVDEVAPYIWFSGYYKDEKTRFGQLAVESEPYFRVHPEYAADPEQMEDYMADLTGAIAGVELVERYGWRIGDKITLIGTIYPGDRDLTLRGVYTGAHGAADRARLFMHYKMLDPADGHAHRLAVKADPAAGPRIDELFANTDTPTKTESQLSVQKSWASWSTAVVTAIDVAAALVLSILILVLGNSMAMAAREGTREYATLRAIGFRSRHVAAFIIAEGLVIGVVGVVVALAVISGTLSAFSTLMEERLGGSWQLELAAPITVGGVMVALVAAMLASVMPAWRTSRLPLVDALKKTN